MNLKQSIERFYKTTKMHELNVLVNNESCISLEYKMGCFSSYGANIAIANEVIVVYGDVGSYVFKIESDAPALIHEVDLDKLANCCISVDIISQIYEFNFNTFFKSVIEYANKYCDEKKLSESTKIDIIDDIKLYFDEDLTEGECVEFVHSYEFEHSKGTFMLPIPRELRFGDYNMNFVWCCYAIHEALKLYAKQKKI